MASEEGKAHRSLTLEVSWLYWATRIPSRPTVGIRERSCKNAHPPTSPIADSRRGNNKAGTHHSLFLRPIEHTAGDWSFPFRQDH